MCPVKDRGEAHGPLGKWWGRPRLLPEQEQRGKNPTFLSPGQTQLQASREGIPGDTEPREGQPFRALGVVADTTLRKLSSLAPCSFYLLSQTKLTAERPQTQFLRVPEPWLQKPVCPSICKTAFSPDRMFEYNVVFQSFSQHRNNLTNW